jgi:hypothetical protein
MCRLLKLTFVSQSVVVITAQFAGIASHNDNIMAFRKQVSREAGVITTVNWGRCFPEVYATVAEHLAFHTALVSRAQAYALDLYATGYKNIPNPLDEAQHEVSTMHASAWSPTLNSSGISPSLTRSTMRLLGSAASFVSAWLRTPSRSLVSVELLSPTFLIAKVLQQLSALLLCVVALCHCRP